MAKKKKHRNRRAGCKSSTRVIVFGLRTFVYRRTFGKSLVRRYEFTRFGSIRWNTNFGFFETSIFVLHAIRDKRTP